MQTDSQNEEFVLEFVDETTQSEKTISPMRQINLVAALIGKWLQEYLEVSIDEHTAA